MKRLVLWACCVFFLMSALVVPSHAKLRPAPPKRQKITISFLAELFRATRSTIGPNETTYIALLRGKGSGIAKVVKISYRALDFEADIPSDFVDVRKLHKFTAIRDIRCDQSLVSVREQLARKSSAFPRQYLDNSDSDTTAIECFVITPDDYKWTRTIKAR